MYVCICKNVKESDIALHTRNGCRSLGALKCKTGVGSQCGVCRKHVKAFLQELQHNSEPMNSNARG